ncbi:MAG: hypothetical protein M3Y07_00625 [Acidobacteriota bacterium]|nr:hypothetical protein [Acidobacteriota bacterium]
MAAPIVPAQPSPVNLRYLDFNTGGYARKLVSDNRGDMWVVGVSNDVQKFDDNFNPVAGTLEIIKLDSSGKILFRTQFGSGSDAPYDATVNSQGDLYVVGTAGDGFPLVNPLPAEDRAGGFVMSVDANGNGIRFATTFAGAVAAIALDRSANTYLTGWTSSSSFPVTPDAFQKIGIRTCVPSSSD